MILYYRLPIIKHVAIARRTDQSSNPISGTMNKKTPQENHF